MWQHQRQQPQRSQLQHLSPRRGRENFNAPQFNLNSVSVSRVHAREILVSSYPAPNIEDEKYMNRNICRYFPNCNLGNQCLYRHYLWDIKKDIQTLWRPTSPTKQRIGKREVVTQPRNRDYENDNKGQELTVGTNDTVINKMNNSNSKMKVIVPCEKPKRLWENYIGKIVHGKCGIIDKCTINMNYPSFVQYYDDNNYDDNKNNFNEKVGKQIYLCTREKKSSQKNCIGIFEIENTSSRKDKHPNYKAYEKFGLTNKFTFDLDELNSNDNDKDEDKDNDNSNNNSSEMKSTLHGTTCLLSYPHNNIKKK